jgi:plasmid stability protein
MIQIRNVPAPLHRKLKARAAMAGTSLSAYLLEQIAAQASVPTPQELTARLERLEPVAPREGDVEALQRVREER